MCARPSPIGGGCQSRASLSAASRCRRDARRDGRSLRERDTHTHESTQGLPAHNVTRADKQMCLRVFASAHERVTILMRLARRDEKQIGHVCSASRCADFQLVHTTSTTCSDTAGGAWAEGGADGGRVFDVHGTNARTTMKPRLGQHTPYICNTPSPIHSKTADCRYCLMQYRCDLNANIYISSAPCTWSPFHAVTKTRPPANARELTQTHAHTHTCTLANWLTTFDVIMSSGYV